MSVENYQRTIYNPAPETRNMVLPEPPRYQYQQAPMSQIPQPQPTKFTLPPIRELLRDSAAETAPVPVAIPPQQFNSYQVAPISPDMSRSNSHQSMYSHQPPQFLQQGQLGRISPTVIPNLQEAYPSYPLQTPPHQIPHNLPSPSSSTPSPMIIEDSREKLTRRKRQNLPRQTTLILLNWLSEHLDRPYPNSREKYELLMKTRLTIQQLDNWFINARRRKINILKKLKENDQSIALSI